MQLERTEKRETGDRWRDQELSRRRYGLLDDRAQESFEREFLERTSERRRFIGTHAGSLDSIASRLIIVRLLVSGWRGGGGKA